MLEFLTLHEKNLVAYVIILRIKNAMHNKIGFQLTEF